MEQDSLNELRKCATALHEKIHQYETLVALIQLTDSRFPRTSASFDQTTKDKIITRLVQAQKTLEGELTPLHAIKTAIVALKTAVEQMPTYVKPNEPVPGFVVVKHKNYGTVMHAGGYETSIDYYVRKYPADDPGGEYQYWGSNGREYACDPDGNKLAPAVDMTPLQAHLVTPEDIFQDIRDLATKARPADGTKLAPVIEQQRKEFYHQLCEGRLKHDLFNAYTVMQALIDKIKLNLAPSDKDSIAVAVYLSNFCQQLLSICASPFDQTPHAQMLQAHLNQYYTQAPLRLQLAGLHRLNNKALAP